MKRVIPTLLVMMAIINTSFAQQLKIAIAGMDHDHIYSALNANKSGEDITIVGFWEPNTELAHRLLDRYGLSHDLLYSDLDEMLDAVKPEGVAAFGSIYDHLKVVEAAAPRSIDVMVEKPLAVSPAHAKKIEKLAREHEIIVMTNYETSWYSSLQESFDMIDNNKIGPLRKVIVYDGHIGPIGINISKEFEAWLTDPVLNGGGAVIDFGCYGANIMTALQKGEKPSRVYADIRTHNKELYPRVDDDATILLSYGDNEGIINGSWAWCFNRKDMHIYGRDGYILTDNDKDMRVRIGEQKVENIRSSAAKYRDGFAYFRAWIRGEVTPESYDISALENNMIVVDILDAAKRSAKKGRSVKIK